MKMKRLIALLLVLTFGVSLFGCYNPYASRHTKKDRNSKHERNVDEDDDEDEDEDEDETEPSETTTEATTNASSSEPAATTSRSNTPAADCPYDLVEASSDNPAKLNEWFPVMRYNPSDTEYHQYYARITGVYSAEESETYINAYLAENTYATLSDLEYDDIERRCFTYEVYFPEDTPAESWGVSAKDITTDICTPSLGYSFTGTSGNSYILSTWDISLDVDTYPGEVYNGVALFTMTTGCNEFYIKVDCYDGENFDYVYCNPFA